MLGMVPLPEIVKETKLRYPLKSDTEKLNHLLLMGDIKLITTPEAEPHLSVQSGQIFSNDITMEM